ncbi:choice-of-anchor D domain-containing protein [Persicirhabdus sediminis]|uniref:Choice-of-anchor D domain-containing protein n=1 Tax=Persicirhabdus sediminis TaxID=454144 RepID=A0A8J7SIR4_9BACT|nr:choice-of-anchor D domain-containing protein [Persicirhabdus sediminis]MBK1790631.1 choice-of-anchor D domain-containing protein [Persicirhabdus sediminis]
MFNAFVCLTGRLIFSCAVMVVTISSTLASFNSSWLDSANFPVSGAIVDIVSDGSGNAYVAVNAASGAMVYRWDGGSWALLGAFKNRAAAGSINDLHWGNNRLYVAGLFTNVDGGVVKYLAQYSGGAWSHIGSGINIPGVAVTYHQGAVYLATASRLYFAPGDVWQTSGGASVQYTANGVSSLYSDGANLYMAGSFTQLQPYASWPPYVYRAAKWNGSSWSQMASGVSSGEVNAITGGGGSIYVGGSFSQKVLRYSGDSWSSPSSSSKPSSTVNSLVYQNGNLFAGGSFGLKVDTGTSWETVASGVNGSVNAMASYGDKLFVGGTFTSPKNYFAVAKVSGFGEIAAEDTNGQELSSGTTFSADDTLIGASSTLSFTLKNVGDASLSLSDYLIEGVASSDFAFVSSPPASLAAGESASIELQFAPSSAGDRSASLTIANNDLDEGAFVIQLAGEAIAPAALFADAAAEVGLVGDDALPTAQPFADGSSNLLKYAFNMQLGEADRSHMTIAGTSGLPLIERQQEDGDDYLVMVYLQRRGVGLVYECQLSSDLAEDGFVQVQSPDEQIEVIDANWQRVTVKHAIEDESDRLFGRVKVILP